MRRYIRTANGATTAKVLANSSVIIHGNGFGFSRTSSPNREMSPPRAWAFIASSSSSDCADALSSSNPSTSRPA